MIETSTSELRGRRALWRVAEPFPAEIRQELEGHSPMLCHVLYCRGYTTAEEIRGFFSGRPVSHDPFLLPDMAAAVHRIAQAAERGERVAIYGDFDCDGLTSAAVLRSTLEALGLRPAVHIPTREHGHGLHPEALAALADAGISLVITADCGVTAVDEVAVARGMGMDVIVTDHHEARADGSLPDCPTVDPTRHDSEYPFRSLCGVGIAYKVAQALTLRLPGAADPDELLDLVALGTVADVVPLKDENRWLVIQGLERLQRTERPGLLALFQAAGVDRDRIDPVSVGFYLAPRINAANRMATPQLAYDLITATDPERATRLAEELSALNQQRQLLVAETLEGLVEQLGDPIALSDEVREERRPPFLLVVGDWPAGISGLLASKLVDTYGLPAFVGADAGEPVISVSARGLPGVHIDEMLEGSEAALPGGLFLGYGGHARAGGFRVERERMGLVEELLAEQAARQLRGEALGATLAVDAEVWLGKLTLDAAKMVRTLAPFGTDFSEPLFLVRGVALRRVTQASGGKHARVTLQQGPTWLDGIAFNAEPEVFSLRPGARLDVVCSLQVNEYLDRPPKPEICVRDWRLAG